MTLFLWENRSVPLRASGDTGARLQGRGWDRAAPPTPPGWLSAWVWTRPRGVHSREGP